MAVQDFTTVAVRMLVAELARARARRGWSQSDVGARAGVKQPTVSGWESDDSWPLLATVVRWADALGFDVVLVPREKEGCGDSVG